jgi:hypothetical protein
LGYRGIGRLSYAQISLSARTALNSIKPGRIESPAGKAVKDAAAEVCIVIGSIFRTAWCRYRKQMGSQPDE